MAVIVDGKMPKGCFESEKVTAFTSKLHRCRFQESCKAYRNKVGRIFCDEVTDKRLADCPCKAEIPDDHGDLIQRMHVLAFIDSYAEAYSYDPVVEKMFRKMRGDIADLAVIVEARHG